MNHFSPRPVIDPATERRAGEVLQPPLPRIDDIDLDAIEDHRIRSNSAIAHAVLTVVPALAAAAVGLIGLAFIFIAIGAWCSFRAVAHTNRADSILQRSLAASLVEEGPAVLAEAA